MEQMHFYNLGLIFFTALFLSLFIVPVTIVFARKVGAVDIPKKRSSHSIPVTRLGGLGIAASLLITCLMFLPHSEFISAFLTGLLLIIATGMMDDILGLGTRMKFAGQIVAASAFVLLGGGSLLHLGSFLGQGEMTLDQMSIPFTIFCMVGGMNAFNLSDGLDGLAGGLTAIASVFFAYFAFRMGAPDLVLVCIILFGAVMGFLRYNSYPAKLFMGDCGSLTLGYVLAAILVSGSQRNVEHFPLVIWVMVVSLPLLDTILVMVRRLCYGTNPFLPDRSHLHHRLMALGMDHPAAVAVMYLLMALFGVVALFYRKVPEVNLFAALLVMGLIIFGSVSALQHMKVSFASNHKKWTFFSIRSWPILIAIAKTSSATAIPVSMAIILLLCMPALFFAPPRINHSEALALFFLAGVVVFYSMQLAQGYKGMLHASIYISIFTLCYLYNFSLDAQSNWQHYYLVIVSVFAATWVVIKFLFQKHINVLRISSFELLILLLSWFLPFVLFPEIKMPEVQMAAGRLACLEVVPFMLVCKIYLNLQPIGNKLVVGSLAGAIIVVGIKGFL